MNCGPLSTGKVGSEMSLETHSSKNRGREGSFEPPPAWLVKGRGIVGGGLVEFVFFVVRVRWKRLGLRVNGPQQDMAVKAAYRQHLKIDPEAGAVVGYGCKPRLQPAARGAAALTQDAIGSVGRRFLRGQFLGGHGVVLFTVAEKEGASGAAVCGAFADGEDRGGGCNSRGGIAI